MNTIKTIVRTTDACPTQWEGTFEDGDALYIRYRWGHLTIQKGNRGYNGTCVFAEQIGDDLSGWLDDAMLVVATQDEFAYPPEFTDDCWERDRVRAELFDANIRKMSEHFEAGGTLMEWVDGDIKTNDDQTRP